MSLVGARAALIAAGLALIVGGGGAFALGYRLGDAKVDRIQNQIRNRTIIRYRAAAQIAEDVGRKTAAAEVRERVVTRTIQEKVPIYVPVSTLCSTVPSGFVRVFNAAAAGTDLPASPPEPPDAPSGVALATVADVAAENFGICRETAARLRGWQAWYPRVKAAFERGETSAAKEPEP